MLLDTGLRARELTSLLIGNVNLKTGRVIVGHGVIGGAKGGKGRMIFIGKSSRHALWRYLTLREDGDDPNSPLFLAIGERKMSTNALRLVIKSLAWKAEVDNAYPHKFDDNPMSSRLQVAELDYLVSSEAGRTVLSENCVGLPYEKFY